MRWQPPPPASVSWALSHKRRAELGLGIRRTSFFHGRVGEGDHAELLLGVDPERVPVHSLPGIRANRERGLALALPT